MIGRADTTFDLTRGARFDLRSEAQVAMTAGNRERNKTATGAVLASRHALLAGQSGALEPGRE